MIGALAQARDVLRRRLAGAALLSLAVLALTLSLAVLWPPVYRAEAVLIVTAPDTPPEAPYGLEQREAQARLGLITQRLLTRSRLIEASQALELHDPALYDGDAIVDDMRSRIDLKIEGGGDYALTLLLGFTAANPRIAANVANALADDLIAESVAAPDALSLQTRDILEREARRHDAELEHHTRQLAEFRQTHAGTLPEALPALRARAEALQAQLAAALSEGTADINGEIAELEARIADLHATIESAQANAVTLARLERARAAAETRHRAVMHRFVTLRPGEPGDVAAPRDPPLVLSLLDAAAAPDRPVSPDRGLIAASGLGLGLLAGLGFVFGAEALDQTVRSPRDIARRLGQAPLAAIPMLPDPMPQPVRHRLRRQIVALAVPAGLVLLLYGVHRFVLPFDLLLEQAIVALGLEPLLEKLHRAIAG